MPGYRTTNGYYIGVETPHPAFGKLPRLCIGNSHSFRYIATETTKGYPYLQDFVDALAKHCPADKLEEIIRETFSH